jgi:hypothetical protein
MTSHGRMVEEWWRRIGDQHVNATTNDFGFAVLRKKRDGALHDPKDRKAADDIRR